MKVIAAIEADFATAPLGTRSRLASDLCGETVLRRTLARVKAARDIASVHLVVPSASRAHALAAVGTLEVGVEDHAAGPVPWLEYVRSSRKWAIDGWRGGIGDSTVFDESINPWVLAALAAREDADAVAVVPAAAVLLDPELLDRMIRHFENVRDDVRMVFTQTAPGLSAPLYMSPLLSDLANGGQPPGRVMAYRPNEPQRDMVSQPCFYTGEAIIAHAEGRCLADTSMGVARVTAVLAGNGAPDGPLSALEVSQWLAAHRWELRSPLPDDVEVELTTEDPLANSTLRPRGASVPRRGPMTEEVFARLVNELGTRDDVRLTLGGFGDPLLHPEWPALVRRCREAGIFGLAIRTPGVNLDSAAIDPLLESGVDVLHILLDAATPETYHQLHHADLYEQVLANLQRFFAAQTKARGTCAVPPLVVCEMSKTRATMEEMERFYDDWVLRAGAAMLVGPSHYARQWPDLAVMNMAPPNRRPCSRLFNRAMVLADGTVTVCDQDFRGLHAAGSLSTASLEAIWTGTRMQQIRRSHVSSRWDAMPLCPLCDEWHRP